ncbi:hypothetical protein HPB51_005890 [Rhipicephalus microplus]|uniref:SAP domain-containing protein n=1 Tax=Rhipicephalus microplus TaxID=6941 RepID=A0A9J6D436_RHIMP|nr:hypothetical protein HPB51_005890 [Rhipicephalus microplus]
MADSVDVVDAESVRNMKVADLKKELKARGLSTAGNKSELTERLEAALGLPKVDMSDVQLDGKFTTRFVSLLFVIYRVAAFFCDSVGCNFSLCGRFPHVCTRLHERLLLSQWYQQLPSLPLLSSTT